MKWFYNFGIRAYRLAINLAAAFDMKARNWVEGRMDWRRKLREVVSEGDWVWFHCASLGEFEQGRMLIEKYREEWPDRKILLTFFSPSGYEIRKNYQGADLVFYLPADTPLNAFDFLVILKPQAAFFIKYDIWVNYILELQKRQVPTYLVSAILKLNSRFVKSMMKGLFKKAFLAFTAIFTQDEATKKLLVDFCGHKNIHVTGDTRFDRALQLPENFKPIPEIEAFTSNHFTVVCGSPWPEDEKVFIPILDKHKDKKIRWIIAPHEIDDERIDSYVKQSKGSMIQYSRINNLTDDHQVIWIDNIGMLNRLYHYADVVYIGGGFGAGIHNTQEAAVYGKPLSFGPKFETFKEAVDMVKLKVATPVKNYNEFEKWLLKYFNEESRRLTDGLAAAEYMRSQAGATQKIINLLKD